MGKKNESFDSVQVVAKAGLITLLGLLIGKIIGYGYVLFATRLGTETYGLLSLASAIVSFAVVISLLGLDQGILRFVPFYLEKKDENRARGYISFGFKLSLIVSLIFSAILFIFSEQIATQIFHKENLSLILKIFSLTIPLLAVSNIFLSSLRAFKKVGYEVFTREIAEKSIRLFLIIIIVFFGLGVIGASLGYLASAIGVFLISFYLLNKVFSLRGKQKPIYEPKEMFSYSLPLLLSGFMIWILAWVNIILVGYFRTSSEVGIYNAVLPTATLMFVLPSAIISLFLPVISGLYARKKDISIVYKRVTKWIFVLNFPLVLLFLVFSKKIIEILFGQDYILGRWSLSILVIGYFIYSISYTSSNTLSMLKKTRLIMYITLISALINIVLNYILIPRMGITGSAIGTSLSFIIASLLYMIYSYRALKIFSLSLEVYLTFFMGILSVSIIYLIRKLFFTNLNLFGIIFLFSLFLILYLVLIIIFKVLDKEDYKIINSVINKLKGTWKFLLDRSFY